MWYRPKGGDVVRQGRQRHAAHAESIMAAAYRPIYDCHLLTDCSKTGISSAPMRVSTITFFTLYKDAVWLIEQHI